MTERSKREGLVGPVLVAGPSAEAVVRAIREVNDAVEVVNHGSYLRVLVPARCRVTRAAIEQSLGAEFRMPMDLERIMPSFKGRLAISEDDASWSWSEESTS